jgi:hypothetical protein
MVLHNYANPLPDIITPDGHKIGVSTVVVAEADEKPSIFHGKLSIELRAPTAKVGETEI